jgi:DNA topoisomerase VI subunit B
VKELRLALMEAGRRLGVFVRAPPPRGGRRKEALLHREYLPHIGDALQQILGLIGREAQPHRRGPETILDAPGKI